MEASINSEDATDESLPTGLARTDGISGEPSNVQIFTTHRIEMTEADIAVCDDVVQLRAQVIKARTKRDKVKGELSDMRWKACKTQMEFSNQKIAIDAKYRKERKQLEQQLWKTVWRGFNCIMCQHVSMEVILNSYFLLKYIFFFLKGGGRGE